jgi:hypothetical protein
MFILFTLSSSAIDSKYSSPSLLIDSTFIIGVIRKLNFFETNAALTWRVRAKHLIQSSTLLQDEMFLMFSEDYFHLLPVNIVYGTSSLVFLNNLS